MIARLARGSICSEQIMAWLKFFAAPEDFSPLLERLLDKERRLFEVYSEPGQHAREFADLAAARSLPFGEDPRGTGIALHLALWSSKVMPHPSVRRIELRQPPGSWRETVEGCGLFWLQTGGLHDDAITASSLGWFTRGAAARQCAVQPGPETVDWECHAGIAQSFKRLVQRELRAAFAGPHAVFADALRRHRTGTRLITGSGARQEFHVEAT